jgi:membrane protease YdiL (CAAX protease family)
MSTVAATVASPRPVTSTRPVLYLAWAVILLLTVPEIVGRGFLALDTWWMLPARIALLAGALAVTFTWAPARPIRGMLTIFLVIYAVEAGLFLTAIPQTRAYQDLVGADTNLAFLGERLLRMGAVLGMIVVLLLMGLRRRDFYLAVGDLRATAVAMRIPRKPEPWTTFGRNYAIISVALLLGFLIPALQPSLANASVGLILFAAICAGLNAFAEEFLYRAALIPHVLPLLGTRATLLLLPVWFGLAHWFGVPSGLTGVLLAAIGAWFFTRSMIETRGIAWAWFLHFLADFTVYLMLLLAGAV